MSTTTEGTFTEAGVPLYTKTWTPSGDIKAKLIFVHGYSEHINRYDGFFTTVADAGIQVLSWDQRGWGKSAAKTHERGLTGPTTMVIADVAAFVKRQLPSDIPVFMMGHSMGGGELATFAADPLYKDIVAQIRGFIFESPFMGFSKSAQPNALYVLAGRLAGRLMPKFQLTHVVPPETLSRDEAWVESVRNDPLCHNTGTLEGLASLLDRTGALANGKVKVGKHVRSMLMTHGTEDRECSFEAAMKWFEEQDVQDKTAKPYEGAYHQLHADHCKEEFGRDVVGWILERSQVDGSQQAKL